MHDTNEECLDPNEPIVHCDDPARKPDLLITTFSAAKKKEILVEFHQKYIQEEGAEILQNKPTKVSSIQLHLPTQLLPSSTKRIQL